MNKLGRHIQHYLPLCAILSVATLGFIFFPYDRSFQGAIAIAVAAGYISWGIIHHYIHGDLTVSIITEYITIAILGVVIIFSLLYL